MEDRARWGDNYGSSESETKVETIKPPAEIKPAKIIKNPLVDGVKTKTKTKSSNKLGFGVFIATSIFAIVAIAATNAWGVFIMDESNTEIMNSPWVTIITVAAIATDLILLNLGIYTLSTKKSKKYGVLAIALTVLTPIFCWVAFSILTS